MKGLVIADTETYYLQVRDEDTRWEFESVPDGLPGGISQCPCPICTTYNERRKRQRIAKFHDYVEIYPERTKELTEHQYLVCAANIWAFHVESRAWRMLDPNPRHVNELN